MQQLIMMLNFMCILILYLKLANSVQLTNISNDGLLNVHSDNNKLKLRGSRNYNIFLPPDLNILLSSVKNITNNRCRRDGIKVINSIMKRERWAMQMLDSSAKFPVGLLYGSTYQMGNFDECIEVNYENISTSDSFVIKGQYCLASILRNEINNNIEKKQRKLFNNSLHWAICMPSACSNEDTHVFLNELFKLISTEDEANGSEVTCHLGKLPTFNKLELTYAGIILIFLVFVCTATFYHLVHIYNKGKCLRYSLDGEKKYSSGYLHKIVLSFSIVRNVGKILQTKGNNELNLNCVGGVKFICMGFIIPAHTLLFMISGPVMNTEFYGKSITKVENGLFLNNPLLVDTFLFLSGFLMCRLLILELDRRNGKVNFLILYIGRYIRLTPSYLVVIGFYCTFLSKIGSGPLWKSTMFREQERCLNSWWSNILYINNYINTDYLCMFQSWYLAADTQLFFIAPFIIYPLWRYKIWGKLMLVIVTIASVVTPGIQTYRNRLDPTFMIYPSEVADLNNNYYFTNVYIKTHIRASSYCVGLIFGYVVYKLQTSGLKIPLYINCLCWLTSILSAVASMFSVTIFYQHGYEYNVIVATIYSAFHRVAWCMAIGWILTACITGNGGIINKFLSWKLFMPLSRLTYCAYLVNGIVELYALGTIRQPRYMSIHSLGSTVLSHLVLTFTAAFVLCVLFESPIHNLEKILLEKYKTQSKNRGIILHNNENIQST